MNLAKLKMLVLDTLFPTKCVACNKLLHGEETLCEDCFAKIEVNSGFYCSKCGARLPEVKLNCHKEEKFILAAVTSYQSKAVRELIHSLKYNKLKIAVKTLEELIASYLSKLNLRNISDDGWFITPIPLYPKKERKRGFNQSRLIAEILGRRLKIPIYHILRKNKDTQAQVKMKNYEARAGNINGSFAIDQKFSGKLGLMQNVILVDDVFTSGATMREAVKVLKSAGAKKIIAFVIAKA